MVQCTHDVAGHRPATSWVHYITSCNTQSSAPEDGKNNFPKYVELTGIINKLLLLHLVGCLYYLYQWCTVKQISDNEIYLFIKYIKSVLWRVVKRLSYKQDARCLKVNLLIILYHEQTHDAQNCGNTPGSRYHWIFLSRVIYLSYERGVSKYKPLRVELNKEYSISDCGFYHTI